MLALGQRGTDYRLATGQANRRLRRIAQLGGQACGGLGQLAVPAGHTAVGENPPGMNKRGREPRPRCVLTCWGTRTRT